MSFVAKGVKKVFKLQKKIRKKVMKVAKKVVKSKWFKIAVIVGLSIFTAGVASGLGFGAFTGVSSVGGFFGAVGTTMSAGWTSIVGGLSAMTGTTGAAATTATTANAGVSSGMGILSGTGTVATAPLMPGSVLGAALPMTGTGTAVAGTTIPMAGLVKDAAIDTGAKNWMSTAFGALTSDSIGGTMLRTGIASGINGYFRGKEREREEYYRENKTIWGGPAFGGSAEGMVFGDFQIDDTASSKERYESEEAQKSVALKQAQNPGLLGGPAQTPPQSGGQGMLEAPQGDQFGGGMLAEQAGAPPQAPTSQPPPAAPQTNAAVPPVAGNIRPEQLGVV